MRVSSGLPSNSLASRTGSYSQGLLPLSNTGMNDIIDSVEALIQRIQVLQGQKPLRQRLIVAIAGAPGSGKSTLAAEICERLNQGAAPSECLAPVHGNDDSEPATNFSHQAVVVPMDGFHLDNAILQERGQMAVKGK